MSAKATSAWIKWVQKVSTAPLNGSSPLRADNRGSIEGLPLYFLVSALVVAVASSALLSMMGGIQGQTLGAVEAAPDPINVTSAAATVTFTVTVKDTDGRPIEGALVAIEGLGASAAKKTDAAGEARFSVRVDLGSSAYGEISVKVTHHGPLGESQRGATVLVTRR